MHEEDDALWSGRGSLPDDLARLQQQLSRLPLPPETEWGARGRGESPAGSWLLAAAAVLLLAALVGGGGLMRSAWRVETVSGAPSLRGLAFAGRLGVGGSLATDDASGARVLVPGLGEVELAPGSELRRVRGRGPERRLALDHGTLRARISAPPRLFVVEARAAVATDLGCAYTLSVSHEGWGWLSVTTGRVAFTDRGHESFVPAGVSCPLTPDGVGVPRREYASDAFLKAVTEYDAGHGAPRGALRPRPGRLDSVLARAEALDAITLWHLLPRVGAGERARVAARIAALIEVPADVPIERVLA